MRGEKEKLGRHVKGVPPFKTMIKEFLQCSIMVIGDIHSVLFTAAALVEASAPRLTRNKTVEAMLTVASFTYYRL